MGLRLTKKAILDYIESEGHPKIARWYNDYLQTPIWKFKRKLVIERAKGKCEQCRKKKKNMVVHHKTYEYVEHEPVVDLMYLCKHCHELIPHYNIPFIERIYSEAKYWTS